MKVKKLFTIILSAVMLLTASAVPAAAAAEAIPEIVKMTPADGAEEVSPVNLVIDISFNTDMDMSTINKNTVICAGIYKIVPDGTKRVRLYMNKQYLGTKISLDFTKGIKSKAGVAMVPTTRGFQIMSSAPQYHQITNGDMEDTNNLGVYNDGAQLSAISFVKEGSNTVLKLTPGWDEAPVLQVVGLEGGKTYVVRAKVKSDAAQNLWFCCNYTTASSSTWYHRAGDMRANAGEWQEMSAKFTIPQEALGKQQDIRIVAQRKGTTVLVDDWQFFEDGYDIPAPAFEYDTAEKLVTRIENDNGSKDRQLLTGLGFFGAKEYEQEEQKVTREAFAKYIAYLIGYKDIPMTEEAEVFNDIYAPTYEGYAGLMAQRDIMTADANGSFNPYNPIKGEDAARAFVVALGYKQLLENALPIAAASKIGIMKGVSLKNTEQLSYEKLNKLLINALDADALVSVPEVLAGKYKYSSVAESLLKLEEKTGIVTATQNTYLDSSAHKKAGYVEIDGKEYKVLEADVTGLIGKKVKFYVKNIDDEDTIIYICGEDKYNKTLKLEYDKLIRFNNGSYEYEVSGGRINKAKTARDKKLIYNYKALDSYTDNYLMPVYGNVELIDNNNDGTYEVVIVTDYQTFVVESFDKENGIIYDKFENKTINLSNSDNITVILNGSPAKIESLHRDNVLTIAQSADGEKTVIYCSNKVVTGMVSRIDDDKQNRRIAYFNDEVHGSEVSDEAYIVPGYSGVSNIKSGDEGEFYIDAFGRVAAVKIGGTSWKFGYLIKTYDPDEKDTVTLKIYTQNNQMEKLDVAKRLSLNAQSYKSPYEQYAAIGSSAMLIKYKQNKEGLINNIITENNTLQNELREIKTLSNNIYLSQIGSLANKVFVTPKTLIFVVPSDTDNTEKYLYSCATADSYLISGKTYTGIAYSANENNYTAQVIVMKDRKTKDGDSWGLGVVSKITKGLSDDDEPITKIEYKTVSGTSTFNADSSIDLNDLKGESGSTGLKLEVGDIVKWQTRSDAYATNMTIIYKGRTKARQTTSNPSSTTMDVACRLFSGLTSDIEGSIIKVTDESNTSEVYDVTKYNKIYAFDKESNKVEQITADEILKGKWEAVEISTWGGVKKLLMFIK